MQLIQIVERLFLIYWCFICFSVFSTSWFWFLKKLFSLIPPISAESLTLLCRKSWFPFASQKPYLHRFISLKAVFLWTNYTLIRHCFLLCRLKWAGTGITFVWHLTFSCGGNYSVLLFCLLPTCWLSQFLGIHFWRVKHHFLCLVFFSSSIHFCGFVARHYAFRDKFFFLEF